MSSTILLVDAELDVRAIIERHLDPAHWTLVQVSDGDVAMQQMKDQPPALVVLNVDVAKGWPLCTQLKRLHAAVPVVVVSFRLGKDVFNNHQKLDTRADAYHRLPEETEGFEISLGYFSSHKSEVDEDSAPNRQRPRRGGGAVQVPGAVVQRLEATVAEQARSLEDARRQIEALEAERDAVAEKNRRQMLELMTVAPTPAREGGADTGALKDRIATLEADLLLSTRRDDELRDLKQALSARQAELDRLGTERSTWETAAKQSAQALEEALHSEERTRTALDAQVSSLRSEKAQLAQRISELEQLAKNAPMARSEAVEEAREAARREAADAAEQLAKASMQLTALARELTQAHQARLAADHERRLSDARATALEQQLGQAMTRAESAESAWSTVNARLEQAQASLQSKADQADQAVAEKKSIEQALATSRRLMREYATDAARKAEELKALAERAKELETRTHAFTAKEEELTQALEFEKSLVESLEKDLAAAKATPAVPPAELEALRAELTSTQAALEAARGELEATRAAARAEVDAARAQAEAERDAAKKVADEDLETLKLLAQAEIDDAKAAVEVARREADQRLEAQRADADKQLSEARQAAEEAHRQFETLRAEAANEIATARAVANEIEAQRQQAIATHASEREALASHVAVIHSRFEAVVGYARALEARLVMAESRRGAVEAKLEEMIAEVRAQALSGEVPPPMDLPSAPRRPAE